MHGVVASSEWVGGLCEPARDCTDVCQWQTDIGASGQWQASTSVGRCAETCRWWTRTVSHNASISIKHSSAKLCEFAKLQSSFSDVDFSAMAGCLLWNDFCFALEAIMTNRSCSEERQQISKYGL